MLRFFIKYSKWIIGVAGILIFVLTQSQWVTKSIFWQKAEGVLTDQRYLWRGELAVDTNIVMVGVQTSSLTLDALAPEEIKASPTLELMTQPFPWNRSVFAATLDRLIEDRKLSGHETSEANYASLLAQSSFLALTGPRTLEKDVEGIWRRDLTKGR